MEIDGDLLDAKAAIDWAAAQIPKLAVSIDCWIKSGFYSTIRVFDPRRGKDAIQVEIQKPLPRFINVETGLIIHSTRTALDILAVALAQRNGVVTDSKLKGVYFPICGNEASFNRDGRKKVNGFLSTADCLKIEQLQPYNTKDKTLLTIHEMDITRKHRRLVSVAVELDSAELVVEGGRAEFDDSRWLTLEHNATIAWVDRNSSRYDLSIKPEIMLTETNHIRRAPITKTLSGFVGCAEAVIKTFSKEIRPSLRPEG